MFLNSTIRWWFTQTAIFHKRLPSNLMLKTFSKSLSMTSVKINTMKPPNIMIYTGSDHERFDICKLKLSQTLNTDRYIIYPLSAKQVNANEPWEDNSSLLIINCKHLESNVQSSFTKYFENGGRLLSFCSDLTVLGIQIEKYHDLKMNVKLRYKSWNEEIDTISGDFKMNISNNDQKHNIRVLGKDLSNIPLIIETLSVGGGTAILLQIDLLTEKQTIESQNILKDLLSENLNLSCIGELIEPSLTSIYLFSKNDKDYRAIQCYIDDYKDSDNLITLKNAKLNFNSKLNIDSENIYNIELCHKNSGIETVFNYEEYFCKLSTKHLGHSVIYGDVVNSTMDFIEGFKKDLGLVAISKKQIGGKGRGGNKWLSPDGCAMFTCQISIDLNSKLGQALPFLQHLGALSVVHAIRSLPGYEKLEICLKWPNDIYVGKTAKIGGVLVNSNININNVFCSLGCGVNLTNAFPTLCINSLIERDNFNNGTKLAKLSSEWLIATALNNLEMFINEFQVYGASLCLPLYYRYWIHHEQELTIGSTGQLVKVKGLDEYGYLTVIDRSGAEISLQPDGNSLDMMKNLIKIKK